MTRTFVEKSWGHEDWIANSPLYCGKDLFIKKGKWLSLHYHKLKTETFYVQGHIQLVVYENPELDAKFTDWNHFEKIVELRKDVKISSLYPPLIYNSERFLNHGKELYNLNLSSSEEEVYSKSYINDLQQEKQLYVHLRVIDLNYGDSFDIPIGMRHALFAHVDSHVLEFSTQHFDEDSYRILNSAERN